MPPVKQGGSLVLQVNGKVVELTGAAAELGKHIIKFGAYMSDPEFTGTFVYKIHAGQVVQKSFERPSEL